MCPDVLTVSGVLHAVVFGFALGIGLALAWRLIGKL